MDEGAIHFGRVGPESGDRLINLVAAFHGESGRVLEVAQIRAIHRLLADSKLGRAWACVLGPYDCGYALAYFCHSLDHAGTIAVLDDFYVVPEFRQRGIGTAMISSRVKAA